MKKVLLISLSLLFIIPATTFAQSCDTHLMQQAKQKQKQKVIEAAKHAQDVYAAHNEQIKAVQDSNGLLTACMGNNWPTINVSQPALQKIISGAQQKATNEACNKARNIISQATGRYQDILSKMDGYENLNIGSYTNNSINKQWPKIGNLKGSNIPSSVNNSNVSWDDLGLPGIPGISGSPSTPTPTNRGNNDNGGIKGIPGISSH